MNGKEKECPCETVKQLQDKVNSLEKTFSVMNTKLNLLIGILGAIGISFLASVLEKIFL